MKSLFSLAGLFFLFAFVSVRGDSTVDYPTKDLRGFGAVSGSQSDTTIDTLPCSVLTITCENDDKAKLVLAKFLSDEQCLPGVTKEQVQIGQWGISSFRFGGTSVTA